MKVLPTPSKGGGSNTKKEMDYSYAGVVCCNFANTTGKEWIIDSGATDHMTGCFEVLEHLVKLKQEYKINLPTGASSVITHTESVMLKNNIILKNVLYIPTFKHSLMSVQKPSKDNSCKLHFHPKFCVIEDNKTCKVKGVGRVKQALYYVVNLNEISEELKTKIKKWLAEDVIQTKKCNVVTEGTSIVVPGRVSYVGRLTQTYLWHNRLGHAPVSKIKKIEGLEGLEEDGSELCIICPLAKFTTLP